MRRNLIKKIIFIFVSCCLFFGFAIYTLLHFTEDDRAFSFESLDAYEVEMIATTCSEDDPKVLATAINDSMLFSEGNVAVKVKNNGQKNIWIRVFTTGEVHFEDSKPIETELIYVKGIGDNWKESANACYYYLDKLKPGETTTVMCNEVVFDDKFEKEYPGGKGSLKMTVYAAKADNNGENPWVADGWRKMDENDETLFQKLLYKIVT